MVKNSKKSKAAAAPGNSSTAPDNPETTPAVSDAPGKAAKATAPPKSAAQRTGKASAAGKPRTAAGARKPRKTAPITIADDDIRLRAYFLAEKRIQMGLPGDSDHDWLEARRQLQEEAGRPA